jgi:WD40 repeat protein
MVPYILLTSLLLIPNGAVEGPDKPILVLDPGGHTGRIWDVSFLPGDGIVTVSYDKTVRIWDLNIGACARCLRTPIGPGNDGRLIAMAVSPDATTMAVAGTGTEADKNAIFLIALGTGQIVRTLRGHRAPCNALAFAPDGRTLASAANDYTARLWHVSTGVTARILQGHTHGNVNCVTFSADGSKIGTASADTTARVWSSTNGNLLQTFKHQKHVFWIAFAPNGATAATCSSEGLSTWGVETGLRGKHFDLAGLVNNCQFADRGLSLFFTGSESGMVNLETAAIRRFTSELMTGGTLSRDERMAATVNDSGEVFVWNTADGRLLRRLVSASRPRFAAGWTEGMAIAFGDEGKRPDGDGVQYPLSRVFRVGELNLGNVEGERYIRGVATLPPYELQQAGATAVTVWRDRRLQHRLQMPRNLGTGDDDVKCVALWGSGPSSATATARCFFTASIRESGCRNSRGTSAKSGR